MNFQIPFDTLYQPLWFLLFFLLWKEKGHKQLLMVWWEVGYRCFAPISSLTECVVFQMWVRCWRSSPCTAATAWRQRRSYWRSCKSSKYIQLCFSSPHLIMFASLCEDPLSKSKSNFLENNLRSFSFYSELFLYFIWRHNHLMSCIFIFAGADSNNLTGHISEKGKLMRLLFPQLYISAIIYKFIWWHTVVQNVQNVMFRINSNLQPDCIEKTFNKR